MPVLLVSGSPRPDGRTIHAVRALALELEEAGLATETLDLAQIDFPIYRGEPVPEFALEWREMVRGSDALILASPEYHGGMSGAIKTFLDYLTFDEIRDRPVGLVGVAQSLHGGTRPALQLEDVVTALWARVVGPILPVPDVKEAFDESGRFRDPNLQRLVPIFISRLQAALGGSSAS
jgi:azobenzene reductase